MSAKRCQSARKPCGLPAPRAKPTAPYWISTQQKTRPANVSPSPMPIAVSPALGALPCGAWLIPVAKVSPISQATISITPWMPKATRTESSGAEVKLRRPSKVV